MNFAVLSELGRFPSYYDIVKSILRYCYRLENLSPDLSLLKDAYECSKYLHSNNYFSWCTFADKLRQYLGVTSDVVNLNKYKFNKSIEKLLENWYDLRNKNIEGKLCTYLKAKGHFGFENYLKCINNIYQRKAFCKFRISAHRLQIELGRYLNVPRVERYCKNCSLNEVENEVHFLCRCTKHNTNRVNLFELVSRKFPNFGNLNNDNQLIFLLSNEDPQILSATA